MKRIAAGLFFLCAGWTVPARAQSNPLLDAAPPSSASDAASTVVVFNERDPISGELARWYAAKREIPADHLVGISCPTVETISRDEYDRDIAEPLRSAFVKRGWWKLETGRLKGVSTSTIRFVALMRGIPLRIDAVSDYEGDVKEGPPLLASQNKAAVDSELAVLGFYTRRISGVINNPYYRSFAPLADLPTPQLLLVCRLDAAYPRTVRAMVENALQAEKDGLWGFAYVDSRNLTGVGMGEGDNWLRKIRDDTSRNGIPCIFDNRPEVFPEHYPIRNAALYFGWYSSEVEGAFKNEKLRLVPGAIAIHIHSMSAETLRLPLQRWCAPLLEHGAAATAGNVEEPYLIYTPHLDIFEERLRSGLTFAEAIYASLPVLSWMTTCIGDPLYRPFKRQQDAVAEPPGGTAAEWVVYREGVRRWFSKNRAAGETFLLAKAQALKSGVIVEGLGCLQDWAGDREAAVRSWALASRYYPNEEDQVRCALHAVEVFCSSNESQKALGLVRNQIKAHPAAEASAVLRAKERELEALPPKAAK